MFQLGRSGIHFLRSSWVPPSLRSGIIDFAKLPITRMPNVDVPVVSIDNHAVRRFASGA